MSKNIIILALVSLTTSLNAGGVLAAMSGYDVVWRFQDLQQKAQNAKKTLNDRGGREIATLEELGLVLELSTQADNIDFLKEWARSGKVYEASLVYGGDISGLDLKEQLHISMLIKANLVEAVPTGNGKANFALKTYEKRILQLYGYLY